MRNSTVVADSICIVGAAGQLGRELVRPYETCATESAVLTQGVDLPELDITQPDSVSAALERWRPRAVINAAAFTDVDACESQHEKAYAVNAVGPGNLAKACRVNGIKLVHVSTDYVFDGGQRTPYEPEDLPNPQSVYGKSKAEGEGRVREALPDHIIVRTSWLFGVHGKNFVKTILRMASERDELRVVADQTGRPTYAADLAAVLLALAQSDLTGTYHFANAGVCSWHGFAGEIVRLWGLVKPVRPIDSEKLDRPAPRPAYSVLDTQKLTDHTGIAPRPWQEALTECLRLLKEQPAGFNV
jgi:dTDP-4-dehydrorhamnose reductase